ncbi:CubicO group peptidase (beta-lactamase class C family) [Kineococcus xinjiangensis]|uniref:CubicO group peptidase (Beta-lactamase class C family) n=1 Tax=Kineococcus xinjiangensis TaxID=512762 RepID=A0A2S6IWC6_9ACTN|nr:serine hydrolase domain-containing protein [Kineococcus xinjiangensis]PPK98669.1 CubicO group peptidase (beta-lactamase class C family) [Kineococcus xinjiangensis]
MPALRTAPAPTAPQLRLPPHRPRTALLATLTGLLAAAACLLVLPRPPALSDVSSGDPALADRLRTAAQGVPSQGIAASVSGPDGTATAAVGNADTRPGRRRPMTATTPQEIGSVTKSLTGLLLADAVRRGEVTPTTTLGEVHADKDLPPELARTTLAELATHRSGLPRLDESTLLRGLLVGVTHGNPYAGHTPASLLQAAADTELRGERGEYAYSNLGAALLGWALAERAGLPYPELLRTRVLEPLGMHATSATPQPLPAGRAHQRSANGLPAEPWTSAGSAPAGAGVWSTAEDLGRLAAAVAAGRAPGQDAVLPRHPTDQQGMRTGWGWYTAQLDGRDVLLTNGAVGGAAASVAVDPATGRSVAVVAPSVADTQTVALRLLGLDVPGEPRTARSVPWRSPLVLVTLGLLVVAPLGVLLPALRRHATRAAQLPDRLRIVGALLSSAAVLAVVRQVGAWQVVPPAAWSAAVGVSAAGGLLLVVRWRAVGWPRRHRALRWISGGAGVLVSVAVLAAVLLH